MFLWKIYSFVYCFSVSRIMEKPNKGCNFNELAEKEYIGNCYIKKVLSRSGSRGWRGWRMPPYFLQSLNFFAITFKNCKLSYLNLNYVCPNTIETCLTPNHLLVCRQLLYSSNRISITIVKNLIVLSSTTDKINRLSNHFLDRWRYEYVVN